jgi:hypothetical protein
MPSGRYDLLVSGPDDVISPRRHVFCDIITTWPQDLITLWHHAVRTSRRNDPLASEPMDVMTSKCHALMT